MPDVLENVLPSTAGREVEPSSELDVGECFAPFIPPAAATPASTPKPKPAARVSGLEKVLRDLGYGKTSTDAGPEAGLSALEAAGNDGDTDLSSVRPNEILTASVETAAPDTTGGHGDRDLHVD